MSKYTAKAAEYNRWYRATHREELKAKERARREALTDAEKERIRAYDRKMYALNKERYHAAYAAKVAAMTPEQLEVRREYYRTYRAAHRDQINANQRKYLARKRVERAAQHDAAEQA